MHRLRFLINRALQRDTVVTTRVLGQPLRLSITAFRELRRIRKMHREADFVERMRDSLLPNDTVYDVGANIGLISLLLALHPAGRACRLHSFEPEPRNYGELCRNLALNGVEERVTPHAVALAASAGSTDLFVRGETGEGRHSIAEKNGSTHAVRVPLDTMDAVARSTGHSPDLVKIDVEGAEGQVLAGMRELLEHRRIRDLFIELHRKGNQDRMPDGTPLHDVLSAYGYRRLWILEREKQTHCHYRVSPAAGTPG